jgi:hypothetical protein
LAVEEAMARCGGGFDLFILGHSIPLADKERLVSQFRAQCCAPILLLLRVGEPIPDADYQTYPGDPAELLRLVAEILGDHTEPEFHGDQAHAA